MAGNMSETKLAPETLAAHAYFGADPASGAVVPPLHAATTYTRDDAYRLRDPARNYSRNGSPTVALAEQVIAALEGAAEARLFASGMAAVASLFETVPQGAHVAAPQVMYYGTRHWLRQLEAKGRIALTLFDPDAAGAVGRAVVKGRTDILWIETPINPTSGHHRHRRGGTDRPWGERDPRRRLDGGEPGADPAAGAGGGHRLPFGDEISERAQRRAGGRARQPRRRRPVAGDRGTSHGGGKRPWFHGGLDADPRHADAAYQGAEILRQCARGGAASGAASGRRTGALSGIAGPSRP